MSAARIASSKLPRVGTTIFTVMSHLAIKHGAVNLGQGFPDFNCDERLQARMAEAVRTRPEVFEPKTRWAMDWYYPVLTGVLTGEAAKARLAEGWETFAMEGLGIRCVSDEPWITASETAECALAYASIGDMSTATDLLTWTRTHRRDDGSYWTGIVYAEPVLFPFDEHTSYTAAAVVLAVDAINSPKDFMQGKKWIAEHKHPDPAQLADTAVDLKTL